MLYSVLPFSTVAVRGASCMVVTITTGQSNVVTTSCEARLEHEQPFVHMANDYLKTWSYHTTRFKYWLPLNFYNPWPSVVCNRTIIQHQQTSATSHAPGCQQTKFRSHSTQIRFFVIMPTNHINTAIGCTQSYVYTQWCMSIWEHVYPSDCHGFVYLYEHDFHDKTHRNTYT